MPNGFWYRGSAEGAPMLDVFGELEYEAQEEVLPHAHSFFEFLLLVDGAITHTVDGRTYAMCSGDLCITRPGELHSLRGDGDRPWRVLWASIVNPQPAEVTEALLRNRKSVIPAAAALEELLRSMVAEAKEARVGTEVMLVALASQLAVVAARLVGTHERPTPQSRMSPLVIGARDYIEGNVSYRLQVAAVAEELHVSVSWLSHQFHKEMGLPVRGHIRRILTMRAMRLLEDAGLKLGSIGDMLGFPSQSCFVTYFRRETGLSPSEHRVRYVKAGDAGR